MPESAVRTLPGVDIFDFDFLDKVISMLLTRDLDDEFYQLLIKIQDTNFWDIALIGDSLVEKYKILLKSITKFRINGKPLEVIKEQLKGYEIDRDLINKILQQSNLIDFGEIESLLKSKIKLFLVYKFMLNHNQTFMEAIYRKEIIDEEKINNVMKSIEKLFNDITFDVSSTEVQYNSEERIEKRFEEYKRQIEGRSLVKIIPTGIDLLNACFDNLSGFESGRVYLFGGAYGAGKTRLMTFFAMNACLLGFSVLHITIENAILDVEKLYDSIILNMPIDELYRKLRSSLSSDEAIKELQGIKSIIKNTFLNKEKLEIKKFRPHRVNMMLIENYIKRKILSGGKKPDMIILDHVDLMTPNVKDYYDEYSKGEAIINDIKDFVERYNIILLSPTQFNREGIKINSQTSIDDMKPVRGEGVAGSLAKLKASDFYITINQNDNESLDNICRLYIDKNRFGISRIIIPISFNKGTMEVKALYPDDPKFNFNNYVIDGVNKLLQRMNKNQYQQISKNNVIDDNILFMDSEEEF